jgi:hypothetical protein
VVVLKTSAVSVEDDLVFYSGVFNIFSFVAVFSCLSLFELVAKCLARCLSIVV